jgi:hypothetical protein
LTPIRRQRDPELRQAVTHAAQGEIGEAFAILERRGDIREVAEIEQRRKQIAREYAAAHKAGERVLVVSPANQERRVGISRWMRRPPMMTVFAQHPGIVEVGCIAHARRYFKEAMPTAAISCTRVLAVIGQLYVIERAASDEHLDAPARQRLRQEQARPILEKLRAYLQEQQAAALPKSPLGAAIGYALRNWVALTRYAQDGQFKIDNNGAEQALRPIVLGRNYVKFGIMRSPQSRRLPKTQISSRFRYRRTAHNLEVLQELHQVVGRSIARVCCSSWL